MSNIFCSVKNCKYNKGHKIYNGNHKPIMKFKCTKSYIHLSFHGVCLNFIRKNI